MDMLDAIPKCSEAEILLDCIKSIAEETGLTPEEFKAFINFELGPWSGLIWFQLVRKLKRAGITQEDIFIASVHYNYIKKKRPSP